MSLICQPNNPKPKYQARIIQQVNRDLGLSPIFNVNTSVGPCLEDFTNPTYYMSGTTLVPTTGLTETSNNVYNVRTNPAETICSLHTELSGCEDVDTIQVSGATGSC